MKNTRSKRFIQPRLQTRLIASFLGLSALAMLLQFLFLGARLAAVAARLPSGGGDLASEIPGILLGVLLISFALFLPVLFLLGVRITFRIAGPVHHMERFLKDVAEGRESKPCRIRVGDELQDLCVLVNAATELPRAKNAERYQQARAGENSVEAA